MIAALHWPLTAFIAAAIVAAVLLASIGGLLFFSAVDLVSRRARPEARRGRL